MTYKAVYTSKFPQYLANLVQQHIACTVCLCQPSLWLLVVTSHLVLEVFTRQFLPSGIVFLLISVLAKLSHHSADT